MVEVTILNGVGGEALILMGVAFWLVYFAQSFENDHIRLYIKLFATFLITIIAAIPLTITDGADLNGLYSLFSFSVTNGMKFFWGLWFVILIYELFKFFEERKKDKLEGTQ